MDLMNILNPESEDQSSQQSHRHTRELAEQRSTLQIPIHNQQQPQSPPQQHQPEQDLQFILNNYPDMHRIIRLLACPECNLLFNDPVTLSCGNTYCRSCLHSYVPYSMYSLGGRTANATRASCLCGRRHVLSELRTDVTIHKLTDLCREGLAGYIPSTIQRQHRHLRHQPHPNPRTAQQRVTSIQHIINDDTDDDDCYDAPIRQQNQPLLSNRSLGEDNDQEFDFLEKYMETIEDEEPTQTYPSSIQQSESTLHRKPINVKSLVTSMLSELDCQVCYSLFIDPVTTPCGHNFCKQCLIRSLDHNDKCPTCRYQLRVSYTFFTTHPTNKTITLFLETLYPDLYNERRLAIEHEFYENTNETPIFVCSLVFPRMPCFLHIYEPRYRLMLRRCLDSRQRQFGMVLPPRNGQTDYSEYGTMLEIRSTEFMADGRSLVETIGSFRFRVLERRQKDGYHTGKIERVDDIDPEQESLLEREGLAAAARHNSNPMNAPINEPTTEELIGVARAFIEDLRNGSAPWLLQRLNSTYGEMPDDPGDFSFWVASVIPIDEYDKYQLLGIRSVRERLKLITYWINQFRDQWWFSRACSIA